MRRRVFLSSLAAAAAATSMPGVARGRRWGELQPSPFSDCRPPADKVLEVFLTGGVGPWESFYYRRDGGATCGFTQRVAELLSAGGSCVPPGTLPLSKELGIDGRGRPVELGPFAQPLWRDDIIARTRSVVLRHNLSPHEAAIPYAITGRLLGRPSFTGLGAPLQRAAVPVQLAASYVIAAAKVTRHPTFRALGAAGPHGTRPLVLPFDALDGELIARLDRTRIRPEAERLLDVYRDRYRAQLHPPKTSLPLRAPALEAHDEAVARLRQAPALRSLLQDMKRANPGDDIASAIRAAAYLLAQPETRYVAVVDSYLGVDELLPYDVHHTDVGRDGAERTADRLWATLCALADVIGHGAEAGSGKLDLARTLVVLKTEFGRTPYPSKGGRPVPGSRGRDHWPYGYCCVLIGGPTRRGVSGWLHDCDPRAPACAFEADDLPCPGSADACEHYTPADLQAALLLAAGVDPLADGNFTQGELSAPFQHPDHAATRRALMAHILGPDL